MTPSKKVDQNSIKSSSLSRVGTVSKKRSDGKTKHRTSVSTYLESLKSLEDWTIESFSTDHQVHPFIVKINKKNTYELNTIRGKVKNAGDFKEQKGTSLRLRKAFKALPNKLQRTLKVLSAGMTVGTLVAAIIAIAGGPFTMIPVLIGGSIMLVLGLVMDYAKKSMDEMNCTNLSNEIDSKEDFKKALEGHLKKYGYFKRKIKKGLILAERRIFRPTIKKLPTGLHRTSRGLETGVSLGHFTSMIMLLSGVSGPFGAIPILAGGLLFIAFGFVLDLAAKARKNFNDFQKESCFSKGNVKDQTVVNKEAFKKYLSVQKGFYARMIQGASIFERKVWEPISTKIPNKFKTVWAGVDRGVPQVHGLLSEPVMHISEKFGPIVMIASIGILFVCAFTVDCVKAIRKRRRASKQKLA